MVIVKSVLHVTYESDKILLNRQVELNAFEQNNSASD